MFLVCINAHAFSNWDMRDDGSYIRSPGDYYSTGKMKPVTITQYPTRTVASDGVTFGRTISGNLPAERSIPVTITDTVKVPRSAISSTAARLVKGGILNLGFGALADMLIQQALTWQESTKEWLKTTNNWEGTWYSHNVGGYTSRDPYDVCRRVGLLYGNNNPTLVFYTNGANYPFNDYSAQCTAYPGGSGMKMLHDGTEVNNATTAPATEPQLKTAFDSATNWATKATGAIDAIVQAGQGIDATGQEVATVAFSNANPESSPTTETKTTTNPDGTTDTETKTCKNLANLSYLNTVAAVQTIQHGIKLDCTTTIVKKDAQGNTIATTTTASLADQANPKPQAQEVCSVGKPNCSPSPLIKPDLDAGLQTFGQLTEGFKGRVAASAVAQSLTGLSSALPSGGNCPTFDISAPFMGVEIGGVLTAHCTILSELYTPIHALFLMLYSLGALFLFFKA